MKTEEEKVGQEIEDPAEEKGEFEAEAEVGPVAEDEAEEVQDRTQRIEDEARADKKRMADKLVRIAKG